jgi:hypothetical protein
VATNPISAARTISVQTSAGRCLTLPPLSGAGDQAGWEDRAEHQSSDRPPFSALGGRMEVVVDVDLAVGAAADENESVDLDRAFVSEFLDRVPVVLRGVGIVVRGDVEIDGGVAVMVSHGVSSRCGGERHKTGRIWPMSFKL